jgi:hypothetical protein
LIKSEENLNYYHFQAKIAKKTRQKQKTDGDPITLVVQKILPGLTAGKKSP